MDCPHLPPGCITHSGPAGPAKRGGVIIPNIPGDRADARVGRSWKDVWVPRVLVMGVAYRAERGGAADPRTSSHGSKLTPWPRPGSHRCWGRGPLRSLQEQWTTLSDSRTGTDVFGSKDQKVWRSHHARMGLPQKAGKPMSWPYPLGGPGRYSLSTKA